MRRINRSLSERKLQKGGGGGGSGRSKSAQRQKLNRTSTNRVDKSTWNQPPSTEARFFKGNRVIAGVSKTGIVSWTLDYSTSFVDNGKAVPAQELRDMKRAWGEYLKSPNAKRKFSALITLNDDGRENSRMKQYQKLGFKR
ncbi:hypothetical protein COO91_03419 [Nostoc flagelliforme CCNUN1]|uniref:Uncharacterized protein n=1 Tax=Nostoc flagelliforme CCNUN1 TaxID=2038116 RepID=A0A2K8SPS9_9NOSO|nr:hypothetical protein [Nostoc flagelliforme]AUB37474.1 hypothetical protein COO91_03419 [Nostoc flagelliforme CCNUN1]